jgi:uncharacterized protein
MGRVTMAITSSAGVQRALRLALVGISALIYVGFVAQGRSASAASFDCKKATTNRERAICADVQLSELDSQVGQLYRGALSQLSPAGAGSLKDQQRAWLAYLGRACPTPTPQLDRDGAFCLSRAYRTRVDDLKQAAVRDGPFLFTRIDVYSAETPPRDDQDEDGAPPPAEVALKHTAVPQIDSPMTPVAADWNGLAMRSDPGGGCEDVDLSYRLGLATSRLISVTWTNWEYCHGTPHGHGYSRVQNVVLTPKPRSLEAGDLFQPGSPWKEKLTALLLEAVEKAARDGRFDLARLSRGVVAEAAATPERWSLREAGLAVTFDPYELGEGYVFAPDVTVPWSALKDVLAGDPTRP